MILLSILLFISICINVILLTSSKSNDNEPSEDDVNDMFIEYQKGINTMLENSKGAKY